LQQSACLSVGAFTPIKMGRALNAYCVHRQTLSVLPAFRCYQQMLPAHPTIQATSRLFHRLIASRKTDKALCIGMQSYHHRCFENKNAHTEKRKERTFSSYCVDML